MERELIGDHKFARIIHATIMYNSRGNKNTHKKRIKCKRNFHSIFFFLFLFSNSIISVKAKSFADREIRYTLKAQGQGAGTFNIGPTSGIVKLAKELDFEDLRQPHVYSLVVTATEDSGGFSTSVEVSARHRLSSFALLSNIEFTFFPFLLFFS